jgi:hypothetical protein
MNKNRAYYRHHRERVINRNSKLAKQFYGDGYYKYPGQFSKGKIHCSCGMCRIKTRYNGWSMSDRRKLERSIFLEQERGQDSG